MQISQTLNIIDGMIRCAECGHTLAEMSVNWKNDASLEEEKLRQLGGPFTTGEQVVLRKFSCPGCGLLLDSELAMPEDPFLEDILFDAGN